MFMLNRLKLKHPAAQNVLSSIWPVYSSLGDLRCSPAPRLVVIGLRVNCFGL